LLFGGRREASAGQLAARLRYLEGAEGGGEPTEVQLDAGLVLLGDVGREYFAEIGSGLGRDVASA
jgi:hypothetical protein